MTAKKNYEVAIPRRNVLDDVRKEAMLAVVCRNKEAFDTVDSSLTSADIQKWWDPAFAFVWRVVQEHTHRYGALPTRAQLNSDINQRVSGKDVILASDAAETIDNFLDYMFDDKEHGLDMPTNAVSLRIAVETCRLFLEECRAKDLRTSLLGDGKLPADMNGTIDKYQAAIAGMQSLTGAKFGDAFPDDWHVQEELKLFTCGCSVLDDFMGGGWMAPELVLFMGPYGSCKTALTCHSVSTMIMHCKKIYHDAMVEYQEKRQRYRNRINAGKKAKKPVKPRRPMVILAFSEGDERTYRNRIAANLATVHWKRLMTMRSIHDLSDAKSPGTQGDTAYEAREFASAAEVGQFVCERERAVRAAAIANQHLLLINCTTTSSNGKPPLGRGGIPEIAGAISGHFRMAKDTYPVAMYLDHLSALVNGMMLNLDSAALSRTLKTMPLQCRNFIGIPHKIPIMIMHQFSGQANKRGPTQRMNHSEGADCTTIAEYFDFVVLTSKLTEESYGLFEATKHRREPPKPMTTIRLRGEFNRIEDISKTHSYNPSTRRIEDRREAQEQTGVTQQAAAQGLLPDEDLDG